MKPLLCDHPEFSGETAAAGARFVPLRLRVGDLHAGEAAGGVRVLSAMTTRSQVLSMLVTTGGAVASAQAPTPVSIRVSPNCAA